MGEDAKVTENDAAVQEWLANLPKAPFDTPKKSQVVYDAPLKVTALTPNVDVKPRKV